MTELEIESIIALVTASAFAGFIGCGLMLMGYDARALVSYGVGALCIAAVGVIAFRIKRRKRK